MRPIKKIHPVDASGNKIVFNKWGEAKPYLIAQTGNYCHFCEMPILNSPSIEHIKNKDFFQNVKNHWLNLLQSCVYCNSRKPKKLIKLYDYYWAFSHNTFLVFTYLDPSCPGITQTRSGLSAKQTAKAQATITLYGLAHTVDSSGGIDTRFLHRLEAISHANAALTEFIKGEITIDGILREVKTSGYWSVWFEIFIDHPIVKERLINDLYADASSFDATLGYAPIPRNPHNTTDPI